MSDLLATRVPGTEDTPPAYRVLVLSPEEFVIADIPLPLYEDEQAVATARRLANGRVVELWDGLRFIERFDPEAG